MIYSSLTDEQQNVLEIEYLESLQALAKEMNKKSFYLIKTRLYRKSITPFLIIQSGGIYRRVEAQVTLGFDSNISMKSYFFDKDDYETFYSYNIDSTIELAEAIGISKDDYLHSEKLKVS